MYTNRGEEERTAVVLRRLEETVLARRQVEVDDLLLVLEFADLHRLSIQTNGEGGDRLSDLGGQGTPPISELALCELGIARGVHTLAARSVAADALDLRHRLPRTYEHVLALGAEVWVARKVAALSRRLPLDRVQIVDDAVAEAITGQSPARVLDLAAAKVIEADPTAHEQRVAEEKQHRYVALGRTDEHGLRTVIARLTAGDAFYLDAMVARVAEVLATHPGHATKHADELRSIALGWLARPAELLQLLLDHGDQTQTRATAFPADLLTALASLDPTRLRPRAVLYLHLHEAALDNMGGVARVEGLGPHALSALTDLLATANVTVKPVIDVAQMVSTTAYEHPEAIKERVHLHRPGDQFPHAASMSRHCDLDHITAYDPDGPPGQTTSHRSQPLSRTPHRAKTHLPYECTPLSTGEVLWRTPHDLYRLVDQTGTTTLDHRHANAWTSQSQGERALVRALHRHRAD